jgi:hypothetical protein
MPMKFTRETPKTPVLVGTIQTPHTTGLLAWPAPPAPDDGRERAPQPENLWSKATECLAYPAGTPVPLDEMDDLITESAMQALHRSGRNANGEPT